MLNQIGEPVEWRAPYAYVPNATDGTISVIDTERFEVLATVAVGSDPYGVAIGADGLHAYVGNRGDNSVTVIDADTFSTRSTALDAAPAGLALDDGRGRLLVALESASAIALIDASTLQEIGRIAVNHPPHDIVASPAEDRLYVLSRSNAYLSAIDLDTLAVIDDVSLAIDAYSVPRAIAVDDTGRGIYVALGDAAGTSSRLAVIDGATLTVDHDASPVDGEIIDLALDGGLTLYVVLRDESACSEVEEWSTASLSRIDGHRMPGPVVRASHGAGWIFALSPQQEAFIAGNTGMEGLFYRVAGTGEDAGVLGTFIGPTRSPAETLAQSSLDFGTVAVASQATRALTVTNTGTLPLTIYESELADAGGIICIGGNSCQPAFDASAFSILAEDDCSGRTLAIGESCTVELAYAPTADVSYGAALRLHTNSSVTAISVSLSGSVGTASQPGTGTGGNPPAETEGGGGGGGALRLTDIVAMLLACMVLFAFRRSRYPQ
jgi:YVTN family beta-propeller protein